MFQVLIKLKIMSFSWMIKRIRSNFKKEIWISAINSKLWNNYSNWATSAFHEAEYTYPRKQFWNLLLVVVNILLSYRGSAGVLWGGRSYRRQVASPWRVGVGIEQTARSLPPRRGRRRWLAPPTPYSIPSALPRYSRLRKDSVTTRRLPITRTPSLISTPPAHSKQPYWSLHACHFSQRHASDTCWTWAYYHEYPSARELFAAEYLSTKERTPKMVDAPE